MTSVLAERRTVFRNDATAQLFLDTLQHYRTQGRFRLYSFVIMRDHVHLLLTPRETTLERVVQLVKGGFSHRLASKYPVWQHGYSDRRIRDRAEFDQAVSYIHQNPVRRKYCVRPEEYRWSSAWSGYARRDVQERQGPSAHLSD